MPSHEGRDLTEQKLFRTYLICIYIRHFKVMKINHDGGSSNTENEARDLPEGGGALEGLGEWGPWPDPGDLRAVRAAHEEGEAREACDGHQSVA